MNMAGLSGAHHGGGLLAVSGVPGAIQGSSVAGTTGM